MARMYCFHCGKTLKSVAGVLTCTAGQMALSSELQRRLEELFPVASSSTSRRGAEKSSPGAGLFCPGCGVELGGTTCPSCRNDLRPYFHAFVELHPHWYPGAKNWGVPLVDYGAAEDGGDE